MKIVMGLVIVLLIAVVAYTQSLVGQLSLGPVMAISNCQPVAGTDSLCATDKGYAQSINGSTTFTLVGAGTQGPPGPAGPTGPKGDPGIQGPPGTSTMPTAFNCTSFTVDSTGIHFTGCH